MKYTMHDGLVANPVRSIYQDKRGFIWIGTFEGISRYDGFRFSNFTTNNGLSHDFINSIYEADGKILVAENNGAIDIIEDSKVRQGFKLPSAANFITSFLDRVLITSDTSGFFEYRNGKLNRPPQELLKLALGHFVSNDSLLIGDGVDNYFFIFTRNMEVYSKYRDSTLFYHYVTKDSKNNIWVCTSKGLKLLRVPVKKNDPIILDPAPPPFNIPFLMNEQVTSILEEKDGSYWIGTMKGLIHLFSSGGYQVYNERDGLPSAHVNTVYKDRENNVWIGTSLGLAKWVSRNNVVFYNTEFNDFKNDVCDIHHLTGSVYLLCSFHGAQQFNFTTKEFRDVKTKSRYNSILIKGGSAIQMLFPNSIGSYDIHSNSITTQKTFIPLIHDLYSAVQHPSGIVFAASASGLYAIQNSVASKLLPDRVTSLVLDKQNNIWVGCWTSGLYRISINENSDSIDSIENMTSLVHQNEIRCLFEDSRQNIWVGTRYGGAYRLSPNKKNGYDTMIVNRRSGLMSEWIKSISETNTGDIWIGTYLGLDRLVRTKDNYRVFNFSKATNFFAQIEKIIPYGDNSWFCIANTGLAYFKDEALHETHPLNVTILSASLGVLENKIAITLPKEKKKVNPNQNSAHFEFSALGFTNEKQIMYSYRLKGSADTSWSAPANVHEASYASLSPGHYHFEVKTIGWNGEHGEPAIFSFYIRTPFWKQGWFIILCIALAGVLSYAIYRYRIQQILGVQKVRNNIATDLHDDIGSSLTNISILSELTNKNLAHPEKAQPFLSRISEEVQASNQAMDDIIWSVNSRNDSIQEIMARMRRYAAELFDNSDIICHLDLNGNDGNKKLGMEQRRDLYLIYKEALNNIHKHSFAKNVWIDVSQNHKTISMQIKDDGKGFNTNLDTHRNGLKNLRSRVEKWNGRIEIKSKEASGTKIHIVIPLKE